MNGQEYLDEISKKSKPVNPNNSSFLDKVLHSPFFLVGAIGIGLFIIIAILGSILDGGNDTSEKTLAETLQLHIEGTSEVIQQYQPNVKSSDLRSSSASLYSVLTNTNSSITTFLTTNFNEKSDKKASEKLATAAEEAKTTLGNELFEAKINGILDRIYAHKMAYEISLFLTEEERLINKTTDESFAASLSESASSLENLYEQFNNFSEGN